MLIKGGKIVGEDKVEVGDIRIDGEKIVAIGPALSPEKGEDVIEAASKLIFPGIIDSHTHFQLQSRGTITADDFYRGGLAAASGGITTVIDYADMHQASLLKGLRARKKEAAEAVIDYNLHLVVTADFDPARHIKEFAALKAEGVSSLKLFTTYQGLYLLEPAKWEPLFRAAGEAGLLVTVHAEKDEFISRKIELYREAGKLGVEYHPDIRPGAAEAEAIRELTVLQEKYQLPIYIVHLSSKEGWAEVVRARKKGLKLFIETTPHYLLLNRERLQGEDGRLNLMTPPLRGIEDNQALWAGVSSGGIDVIATDHCAFNRKQKEKGNNSLDILPGIPGVETLLPLIYSYGAAEGKISLERMVELLSANPAKIFGLYPRKGRLQPGSDADLVIFNPDYQTLLTGEKLYSGAGYTPFQGLQVKGRAELTMLRGRIIYRTGAYARTGTCAAEPAVGKEDEAIFSVEPGYGRFVRAVDSQI